MKKQILSIAVISAIFLAACNSQTGDNKGTSTSKTDSIENTQLTESPKLTHLSLEGSWKLSELSTPETAGKSVSELFKEKQPTLTFHTKDHKVEGNNGCNGIGGTYESEDGNSIKIGDKLVGTMMHCEGVAYNEFMKTLETVTKFDIQNDELYFISGRL